VRRSPRLRQRDARLHATRGVASTPKGLCSLVPDGAARRSTGIAVHARTSQWRQSRVSVCPVGGALLTCSRPQRSTVPAIQLHPKSIACIWSCQCGLYSAQALTNGGNFAPAFRRVGRYVPNAQHRAFLPRLGPQLPLAAPFLAARLGLTRVPRLSLLCPALRQNHTITWVQSVRAAPLPPRVSPAPAQPLAPPPAGSPEAAGEPQTAEKGLTDASRLSPPERQPVKPISNALGGLSNRRRLSSGPVRTGASVGSRRVSSDGF
jgi:hypothetical protein